MNWLLVIVLNGVQTPVNEFETMKECMYSQKVRHQFFLQSNADMKEKQNRMYMCKAIERKPSSSH